jgi:hypothetical protein
MATNPDEELLDEFVRRMSQPSDMSRRQQIEFLENPLIRGLARFAGLDMSNLDAMYRDTERSHMAWLRSAAEFTRFGWTPLARGPDRHGYVEAVEVWDQTQDPAAVDEWNNGMGHLKNAVGPILSLAGRHHQTIVREDDARRRRIEAIVHRAISPAVIFSANAVEPRMSAKSAEPSTSAPP